MRGRYDYPELFLCHLFRSLARRRKLEVFLCGHRPEHRTLDLRVQVKTLMESELGCHAFLGEEIDDLPEEPRVDRNHLTIEVDVARRSDMVVIFLGSPGTLSEVTAFALDRADEANIREKLLVFNDVRFQNARSFINLGPLALLDSEQVVYYEPTSTDLRRSLVEKLDTACAHKWFARAQRLRLVDDTLTFPRFVALCIIYTHFPISWEQLVGAYRFPESVLRATMEQLFAEHMVTRVEDRYVPVVNISERPWGVLREDIARARIALMAKRLRNGSVVSDYERVILDRGGAQRLGLP